MPAPENQLKNLFVGMPTVPTHSELYEYVYTTTTLANRMWINKNLDCITSASRQLNTLWKLHFNNPACNSTFTRYALAIP